MRAPLVSGDVIGQDDCFGGLYWVPQVCPSRSGKEICSVADASLISWHRRFNHVSLHTLKTFVQDSGVKMTEEDKALVMGCKICLQGKMRQRGMGC